MKASLEETDATRAKFCFFFLISLTAVNFKLILFPLTHKQTHIQTQTPEMITK